MMGTTRDANRVDCRHVGKEKEKEEKGYAWLFPRDSQVELRNLVWMSEKCLEKMC